MKSSLQRSPMETKHRSSFDLESPLLDTLERQVDEPLALKVLHLLGGAPTLQKDALARRNIRNLCCSCFNFTYTLVLGLLYIFLLF